MRGFRRQNAFIFKCQYISARLAQTKTYQKTARNVIEKLNVELNRRYISIFGCLSVRLSSKNIYINAILISYF